MKSRTGRLAAPSKLIAAPHGVWCRSVKKSGAIDVQVIPLGAEMVVDDVEQDREAARMARLDQRLQILGPAIGGSGRVTTARRHSPSCAAPETAAIGISSIAVTPSATRWSSRDDRAGEIAALGKRAEMQFVDDHLFPAAARASRYRASR